VQFELDSTGQRREYPQVLHKVTRAIVSGADRKKIAVAAQRTAALAA
jgi:hypothetical protein